MKSITNIVLRRIPLVDLTISLFVLSLTSISLELNIQGIVSAYIDIRLIIGLFILSLLITLLTEQDFEIQPWKQWYLLGWVTVSVLLFTRFFALQTGRDLLALALLACLIGLIFIVLIVIYDSRRKN